MAAVSLQLNMPIRSVSVIDEITGTPTDSTAENDAFLAQQSQCVNSLLQSLEQATEDLERHAKELFLSHKEQIVRLSIEIASKVLAKDIHERNYEIEKIISQALQTVPTSKQISIRLNPDDLKTLQQMSDSDQFTVPESVHFSGDRSVGPAECIIETDHGIIEYLIEEHLKQVAGVLLQANDEEKQEK